MTIAASRPLGAENLGSAMHAAGYGCDEHGGVSRDDAIDVHERQAKAILLHADVTSGQVRAWLEHEDRLFWAFARLRGREGGPTTEDERDAIRLLAILDPRP